MAHKKQICKQPVSIDRIGLIGDDIIAYCETKGYDPVEVAVACISMSEFLPKVVGLIPSEVAEFKRDIRKICG